jgi:hypothetical protein
MSLQTIEAALEAAAVAEWAKIKAEAVKIEQVIVADAESTFTLVSVQFAPLIMTIISNLATGALAKLSGNEKTNLAATTLVEQTAAQGVALLAADATAMVKNGFEAFKKAAPDLGLPSNVTSAASDALDAGEAAVEGAVDEAASAAAAVASKL